LKIAIPTQHFGPLLKQQSGLLSMRMANAKLTNIASQSISVYNKDKRHTTESSNVGEPAYRQMISIMNNLMLECALIQKKSFLTSSSETQSVIQFPTWTEFGAQRYFAH